MHHTILTCENHRHLRWSTKRIAVNEEGRYTGARNIFYKGTPTGEPMSDSGYLPCETQEPECVCSGRLLCVAPENSKSEALYEKWVKTF